MPAGQPPARHRGYPPCRSGHYRSVKQFMQYASVRHDKFHWIRGCLDARVCHELGAPAESRPSPLLSQAPTIKPIFIPSYHGDIVKSQVSGPRSNRFTLLDGDKVLSKTTTDFFSFRPIF
jgi:hypothetical protein